MHAQHVYHKTVRRLKDRHRLTQLLMLVSFTLTFGLVRAVTHLQHAGVLPNQHGAVHIHHLVPGILLLLLSGYTGIAFWSVERLRAIMAVTFGIGAALTLDEFALWLFLRDVYWEHEGRGSIDVVVLFIVLLSIVLIISEAYDHKWLQRLSKRYGN